MELAASRPNHRSYRKVYFNEFVQNSWGCSAAASGWAGWALAHPKFGISVNPITTRGADYAHNITASPPGFEIPAASLGCDMGMIISELHGGC